MKALLWRELKQRLNELASRIPPVRYAVEFKVEGEVREAYISVDGKTLKWRVSISSIEPYESGKEDLAKRKNQLHSILVIDRIEEIEHIDLGVLPGRKEPP